MANADDLALLVESVDGAIGNLNTLKEIAERLGLQISFEKTELMTTDGNFWEKTDKTKYGEITNSFKYLGEIICNNGSEREDMKERLVMMERLSFAVVKQVILYGIETASLPSLRKLLGIERKILRRIYGPAKLPEGYRLRSTRELYREMDDLETDIRLSRLRFYGHIVRMNPSSINREIFRKI
ncbi:uncharacterized protein [Halyomorpha halys]|uniref:uncharacterized protein n=1 Tax=Halyomorpha halys TaxID=286706 RepID=UPI0034D1FA21